MTSRAHRKRKAAVGVAQYRSGGRVHRAGASWLRGALPIARDATRPRDGVSRAPDKQKKNNHHDNVNTNIHWEDSLYKRSSGATPLTRFSSYQTFS